MKSTPALLVACLTIASLALAQELPKYDVKKHCREVAGIGGTYSETTYAGCMDIEQAAYDKMKPNWAGFPSRIRRHCLEVASVGGSGNYSTLSGCIELESEAGGSNPSKEFKY